MIKYLIKDFTNNWSRYILFVIICVAVGGSTVALHEMHGLGASVLWYMVCIGIANEVWWFGKPERPHYWSEILNGLRVVIHRISGRIHEATA